MLATEKRKLENQLMVMGLAKLDDPNLIAQMAILISTQRAMDVHEFYQGLLASCEPEQRYAMYEALRPHLMFEPWSLDKYLARYTEKSANKEQEAPIVIGEDEFQEVEQESATGTVAEFNCYKCTFFKRYLGKTFVDAVQMGRSDGWTRDLVMQKEVCPKCSKVLVQ